MGNPDLVIIINKLSVHLIKAEEYNTRKEAIETAMEKYEKRTQGKEIKEMRILEIWD